MAFNLRDRTNGYYGYLNDEVRDALADIQERGTFRELSSAERATFAGVVGDWTVDRVANQVYAWNSSAGEFQAAGASLAVVQQLIDGSFDGGVTTLLSSNLSIAGGQTAGVPDPLGNISGWYFKNSSDLTDRVNWYYVANSNPAFNMTLAGLDGMYAVVDVRAGGSPFFSVYTTPTGSGDAGSWYKSQLTYAPTGYDLTAYVGQTVLLYWGNDPGDFSSLPRVECTLDSSSSNGPQDGAESVLLGAIGSSASYPAGHYEFVVSDVAYKHSDVVYQYQLSAPSVTGDAPATLDEAFVRMDGVNDYISLSGTGSILDYTATWTVACEITELPSITTDSKFMTLWRSGDNGISLRRGGSNWGFYVANGYNSVAQANTWYAPSAGSRILVECDGTKISYWLDGTRRSHTTMNATHRDNSAHVNDSIDFGRGGIAFGQGTYQDYEGGVDNMLFTNNILSSAQKAEWFAGGDVTTHSYYTAARDFVPCGEGVFPNVVGEKSNVTGSLVNGTSDDFVERT